MDVAIEPCTWKHGKRWSYSVTFDEALVELHDYTIPVHEELGVPGHVEVVVGHLGKVRQIGSSSYNGYRHMDAAELRQLLDMGWGVGSHSWSHGDVAADLETEVRQAKRVLEEAIGTRVVAYTAPGDNSNMKPVIISALQEAGYLCALSVTDDVNRPDGDLWFLNRSSNLHQGFGPLWSAFDANHRLEQARLAGAWVIDYCHCPAPHIPHENKDVYIHEHRARLEAVLARGGDEVWLPTVEEAVDYTLCRRHLQVTRVGESGGVPVFRLALESLPAPVASRQVTVDITVPVALQRSPVLVVDGMAQPALLVGHGVLRANLDLSRPITLTVGGSGQ
ncbi:MAG: polysaccharide deacetylase family protein [Anaerolineae bacterium]